MAHLVKLEDYVSRYEIDLHKYPSQFTRLKREKWQKMKSLWQEANSGPLQVVQEEDDWFKEADRSFFKKSFQRIRGRYRSIPGDEIDAREYMMYANKTIHELQALFHYELFQAQLKWASSSLLSESYMDSKYRYDSRLRQLLRHLPDNFMLFYYPVLTIQQADVQLDVLLISPTELFCITMLETKANAIVHASGKRFWQVQGRADSKKLLNPQLSQNRMVKIVTSIMEKQNLQMPINRIIAAPEGYIDDHDTTLNVVKIDRPHYDNWMKQLQRNSSPLKKKQVDMAAALLKYSRTKAFDRRQKTNGEEFL